MSKLYDQIKWRLNDFPWVRTDDELPPDGTSVLVRHREKKHPVIAELCWDRPGFEDSYKAYRYWDSPDDDGQEWEWHDITHWTVLPELPT